MAVNFLNILLADYTTFKDVTEGIHNIVVVLALIAGSVWTLYTFSSLGARQKAKYDLSRQAVLDITIDCKQEIVHLDKGYYISAIVKIFNKGNRNTFLDFSKNPPLTVTQLVFEEDGGPRKGKIYRQEHLLSSSLVVRSGAGSEYPFIIKVSDQGFYLVSFRVELNEIELGEHVKAGGPKVKGIV